MFRYQPKSNRHSHDYDVWHPLTPGCGRFVIDRLDIDDRKSRLRGNPSVGLGSHNGQGFKDWVDHKGRRFQTRWHKVNTTCKQLNGNKEKIRLQCNNSTFQIQLISLPTISIFTRDWFHEQINQSFTLLLSC